MDMYSTVFLGLCVILALISLGGMVYKSYKNDKKISTIEVLDILFRLREELANLIEKAINIRKYQNISEKDLNLYLTTEVKAIINGSKILTEKEKSILLNTNYEEIITFLSSKIKE